MNKETFTDSCVAYKFNENNFAVEDEPVCLRYFEEQVLDSQK
jgi:hypothetical protein